MYISRKKFTPFETIHFNLEHNPRIIHDGTSYSNCRNKILNAEMQARCKTRETVKIWQNRDG